MYDGHGGSSSGGVVGGGAGGGGGGGGEGPGVKTRLINLIAAVRTLMRSEFESTGR